MRRGISTNRNLATHAACLRLAGVDFAFRYYSLTTHQPEKRLTRSEAEALCAAGLELGAVYEDGPTDVSYFTEARGRQDMASAIRFAAALGQPEGTAIYFTVDYDAPSADTSGPVLDYFQAIGDSPTPYTIGVYGSGAVCDFIKQQCPFVRYSWLAESRGWRGSKTYTGWAVQQSTSSTTLCSLVPGGYEDNQAHDDFGGFVIAQASAASIPT
jgi:hypothetical protein